MKHRGIAALSSMRQPGVRRAAGEQEGHPSNTTEVNLRGRQGAQEQLVGSEDGGFKMRCGGRTLAAVDRPRRGESARASEQPRYSLERTTFGVRSPRHQAIQFCSPRWRSKKRRACSTQGRGGRLGRPSSISRATRRLTAPTPRCAPQRRGPSSAATATQGVPVEKLMRDATCSDLRGHVADPARRIARSTRRKMIRRYGAGRTRTCEQYPTALWFSISMLPLHRRRTARRSALPPRLARVTSGDGSRRARARRRAGEAAFYSTARIGSTGTTTPRCRSRVHTSIRAPGLDSSRIPTARRLHAGLIFTPTTGCRTRTTRRDRLQQRRVAG